MRSKALHPPRVMDGSSVKVLFLASNPASTERLRIGSEIKQIRKRLLATTHGDIVHFESRWAASVNDLLQALLEVQPEIVHFSGHGTRAQEILLEDQVGSEAPVSSEALAGLFGVLKDRIRLVVLNACYSRPQAEAINEHIDFTIGMGRSVSDEAAIEFAATFYQAIGFGRTVQTAFDLARKVLEVKRIPGADIPQLFTRPGVDPRDVVLVSSSEDDDPSLSARVISSEEARASSRPVSDTYAVRPISRRESSPGLSVDATFAPKTEHSSPPLVTPNPVVSVEAAPVVSVEAAPVVSVEAAPVVSVEAAPVVSVEAAPVVSVEAASVVSVEAAPVKIEPALVKMEPDPTINVEPAPVEVEPAPAESVQSVALKVEPAPAMSVDPTPVVSVELIPAEPIDINPAPSFEMNLVPRAEPAVEGSIEADSARSVELTPAVWVELAATVNVELTPAAYVDFTAPPSMELTPVAEYVDFTPAVKSELTPGLNVELTPAVCVDFSPAVCVDLTPEVDVDIAPVLSAWLTPLMGNERTPVPNVELTPAISHAEPAPQRQQERKISTALHTFKIAVGICTALAAATCVGTHEPRVYDAPPAMAMVGFLERALLQDLSQPLHSLVAELPLEEPDVPSHNELEDLHASQLIRPKSEHIKVAPQRTPESGYQKARAARPVPSPTPPTIDTRPGVRRITIEELRELLREGKTYGDILRGSTPPTEVSGVLDPEGAVTPKEPDTPDGEE